ncbi:hypothetical protein F0919_14365 [Taibaiella lutea]|uniref:Uncharacterized protein n=1 Tax=Taibaiella lutea TaxID=2608001 RepID=A0A5M6CFH8_9BACT|nr:hypothetical protein [Taibaiella lutea]KAA5533713.1 hypothetical protein F0919_14365 [Taibaiella lutea]
MAGNSNLFQFIFTTICSSANNPKSNFFLPTVLAGIQSGGSSIIPLKEKNWDIGTLTGSNGSFIAQQIANSYSQISVPDPNQEAIPLPSNPNPTLNLQDPDNVNMVTINGLENAYVQSFQNYNYNDSTGCITADIVMNFNYWTNNPGGLQPGQKVTPLSIDTPFVLTQNLCIANLSAPTTCADPNASPVIVQGVGDFQAGISSLQFTASIQISVLNNRAGLNCQVTNINLVTTGSGAPQFQNINVQLTNSDPALSGIINNLITSALSSSDASGAIFSQMQQSLNTSGNLGALSDTLTSQIASFLNDHMSPVVGQLPSDSGQQADNLVDLYLFDRVRYSLNDSTSGWYVQTLLQQYQNPPLNPFKPSDISLGSFDLFAGLTLSNVTLSNIVVNGFPNATVPAATMILAPPNMSFAILLGSLGSGTNASATFSASYSGGAGQLNFGLTVAINSVSLTSTVAPTGSTVSQLNIPFNSIVFAIPQPSAMVITLDDQSGLAPAVQNVLNSPSVQTIIVNAINSQLTGHLGDIGNEVTSIIQNLVNQTIG